MHFCHVFFLFFFFQAEDGIRDKLVTGVQTCALPIWFCNIQFPCGGTGCVAKPTGTLEWVTIGIGGRQNFPIEGALNVSRSGTDGRKGGDIKMKKFVVAAIGAMVVVGGRVVAQTMRPWVG